MTPEYIVGTLLASGIAAVFALYQRGVAAQIAAKDSEIAWLRSQLEPWTEIARTAVTTTERLTKGDGS
jgi:hypothetical protein